MNARMPKNRWLVAMALPLSIGTLQSRSARAQSIPPIRQSLPPRVPSLPPPDKNRRAASSVKQEQAPQEATLVALSNSTNPTPPSTPAASNQPDGETADHAVDDNDSGYLDNPYLTTDWGGTRTWLLERGVDLGFQYTGEGFARVGGGTGSPRPRVYLGSVVASLDLDTGAMGAWNGGTLHAHMQHVHGKGLSEDHVGSIQAVSNLEADPFTTLAEYWYRQEVLDGRLALKVGKQEGNVDFAASDFAGNLLDSSFGVFPTLALSTYPEWGLGIAAFATPTDWLTIQAAIFDGAPDGREPLGGTTAFEGDGGHLFVGEIQLRSQPLVGGPPGTLRLGAWYHSGDTPALPTSEDDSSVATYGANHGLYGIVDQTLYQPSGDDGESPGLGLFLQAGYAPQDRNEARMYLGGGLAYTGLIPGRNEDTLATGCGHVQLANAIRAVEGRTAETVLELTYKAQLTGFLSLQPDAQYVIRPSGDASVANATVVGIRMVANL